MAQAHGQSPEEASGGRDASGDPVNPRRLLSLLSPFRPDQRLNIIRPGTPKRQVSL
jgi:hypothetical protein